MRFGPQLTRVLPSSSPLSFTFSCPFFLSYPLDSSLQCLSLIFPSSSPLFSSFCFLSASSFFAIPLFMLMASSQHFPQRRLRTFPRKLIVAASPLLPLPPPTIIVVFLVTFTEMHFRLPLFLILFTCTCMC